MWALILFVRCQQHILFYILKHSGEAPYSKGLARGKTVKRTFLLLSISCNKNLFSFLFLTDKEVVTMMQDLHVPDVLQINVCDIICLQRQLVFVSSSKESSAE